MWEQRACGRASEIAAICVHIIVSIKLAIQGAIRQSESVSVLDNTRLLRCALPASQNLVLKKPCDVVIVVESGPVEFSLRHGSIKDCSYVAAAAVAAGVLDRGERY